MVRTHIQQCNTLLTLSRLNHWGSHGADQVGRQVYKIFSPRKFRNHSCSPSWEAGIQNFTIVRVTIKRTTHMYNRHNKVVHRWHSHIPCEVKKWKLVCYGGLSFFQCNFSCSLWKWKLEHWLAAYNSIMQRLKKRGVARRGESKETLRSCHWCTITCQAEKSGDDLSRR